MKSEIWALLGINLLRKSILASQISHRSPVIIGNCSNLKSETLHAHMLEVLNVKNNNWNAEISRNEASYRDC